MNGKAKTGYSLKPSPLVSLVGSSAVGVLIVAAVAVFRTDAFGIRARSPCCCHACDSGVDANDKPVPRVNIIWKCYERRDNRLRDHFGTIAVLALYRRLRAGPRRY